MDQVLNRESLIAEEEDRISNLPDDVIHCILSFLDMKYAIQTSTLSKKWKHIWTSIPHLNLHSQAFPTLPQFAKFVKNALSHRNHSTEVSAVELRFRGVATHICIKSIIKYAYLHNVRKMSMMWERSSRKVLEFPQCLFSSHTLIHLTLESTSPYWHSVPKSAWDFPVLETLNLSNLRLGDDGDKSLDLFSKCVNLKDLTLHHCSMFGLEIFNVCAPQLSNLTITDHDCFSKVFNVVAPQLENLTTSVNCSSRRSEDLSFLRLSTDGLDTLEKVNLSSKDIYIEKKNVPQLLDLFQKLRGAKFLILDKGIIEALSSCVDELVHEPCPFNKLKCLNQKDYITTMPTQLRNYFLQSSPNATFIMDLPQVQQKRPREEVDKAKKVAKLREALKSYLEKLVSYIMEQVQIEVVGGNPDYELIRSIKSTMESIPEGLRAAMAALFSCRYGEMKSLFLTHINASQWAKIEMELGITDSTTHSDNVHSWLNVLDAALPSPSSANVQQKRSREEVDKAKKLREALKSYLEKLVSYIMEQVQVEVVGGNPDYELIRSIKSTMESIPEGLRAAMAALFSCRYGEMKSLFLTHINASQWAKIEMELGITDTTNHSDNVHSWLNVLDAALPSPSSANMATSSSIADA